MVGELGKWEIQEIGGISKEIKKVRNFSII